MEAALNTGEGDDTRAVNSYRRRRADVRRALPERIRGGAHRDAPQDDPGPHRTADPRTPAEHARVREKARVDRRLIPDISRSASDCGLRAAIACPKPA